MDTNPRRPHSTVYRAKGPNGHVWAESSDPQEVYKRARPGDTLHRLDFYITTDGWQPWEPEPGSHALDAPAGHHRYAECTDDRCPIHPD
jgi:hypothetical protein